MADGSISQFDYRDLQGRTVYGSDGEKIGKIADLYDDDSGGAPVFATVHTGMFGSNTTFVPMTQAELRDNDVVVPYTKEHVKGAPSIQADAEVSPQEEQEIFAYYGLGGSQSGGQQTGGQQTGGQQTGGQQTGQFEQSGSGAAGAVGTTGAAGHESAGRGD